MKRIRYYYSRFGIAGIFGAVKKILDSPDNMMKVERKGIRNPFYLRPGTSDLKTFDQVFIRKDMDFETGDPPKIIVDAGANIGLASIYFANKYPGVKIIAIEPEASNFKLLQINAAPYANIIPLQAALWNKNEEISLVDPNLGKWGFMTEDKNARQESHGVFCHTVQGKTLDSIMRDYELPGIDILKMDIEGAEKEVFDDTAAWLGKVGAIIIELHERMKEGCNRSFYNGSNGFDHEWRQGEKIYLSRRNRIIKHPA